MYARQRHRGRHPQDDALFSPKWIPILREAVADLSFLFTRGYAADAASTLVGDHYQLAVRQRQAVMRAACSDAARDGRAARRIPFEALNGQTLYIDGYNLLIIAESMLSDGVLLRGRDGCVRDMASVHGSYRRVEETLGALNLIGAFLAECAPTHVHWLFDAPVSNSGRLKQMLEELASQNGWPWEVELANGVDARLCLVQAIVATSDARILDQAPRWTDLITPLLSRAHATQQVIAMGA